MLQYSRPEVTDFGSIALHTFGEEGEPPKGDPIEPFHLDKFCEFSGGTDADFEGCD